MKKLDKATFIPQPHEVKVMIGEIRRKGLGNDTVGDLDVMGKSGDQN